MASLGNTEWWHRQNFNHTQERHLTTNQWLRKHKEVFIICRRKPSLRPGVPLHKTVFPFREALALRYIPRVKGVIILRNDSEQLSHLHKPAHLFLHPTWLLSLSSVLLSLPILLHLSPFPGPFTISVHTNSLDYNILGDFAEPRVNPEYSC